MFFIKLLAFCSYFINFSNNYDIIIIIIVITIISIIFRREMCWGVGAEIVEGLIFAISPHARFYGCLASLAFMVIPGDQHLSLFSNNN